MLRLVTKSLECWKTWGKKRIGQIFVKKKKSTVRSREIVATFDTSGVFSALINPTVGFLLRRVLGYKRKKVHERWKSMRAFREYLFLLFCFSFLLRTERTSAWNLWESEKRRTCVAVRTISIYNILSELLNLSNTMIFWNNNRCWTSSKSTYNLS